MAYQLLSAEFPLVTSASTKRAEPRLSGRLAQRSRVSPTLVVCGLNSCGRLFFELASVRDISPSSCHIHLSTKPQHDSPLAVRMITENGELEEKGDQLLFQVTGLQPDAEGWDVQANSLAATESRALVFPPHNP